jgi:hypothetical protein
MQGKIDSHCDNDHWEIIKQSKLPESPEGVKVLDSAWAMRRKRRIKTKEIYK